VHRTQIYLADEQQSRLSERARRSGRTRSDLIREAIDRYLEAGDDSADALASFRAAVTTAAGSVPRLPSGAEYVENLRVEDEARRLEDGSRR
jgi:predicted transcriptional regulator